MSESIQSESIQASGKCLCGAISVTANTMSHSVGACHCSLCRKWTGGPLLTVDCQTDVHFDNEAEITRFASSEWAQRGFCKHCGTHLFYRLNETGQYIMPAGLFDLPESFKPNFDHQIFIEEKPDYYSFSNDTHNMTGEEVFAAFSADK